MKTDIEIEKPEIFKRSASVTEKEKKLKFNLSQEIKDEELKLMEDSKTYNKISDAKVQSGYITMADNKGKRLQMPQPLYKKVNSSKELLKNVRIDLIENCF